MASVDGLDGRVGAYLTVMREEAFAAAREADARYRQGRPRGPLDGVPIALKDNLCARGVRATAASRILEGFVPPYDATVVQRLRDAGAVLLGKTNLDEFAMGSSTEHSAYQLTRNPWDLARVPGGSSGGSAAAVAAGMAVAALGSDTGGSVRQPAAFCGVVGVKPTYGRVSRYGLIAFASSLDQIGPLARDVRDAALLLGVVAGADRRDATCVDVPVPEYAAGLGPDVRGLRLGVPDEYFIEGTDPEVERAVRQAIDVLRDLGAIIERVSLPVTEYALATYYIVAPAEASSNLARYDGVKYGLRAPGGRDLVDMSGRTRAAGFGAEVKRRVMLGTYALSAGYYDAYYGRAQKVRTLVAQDFRRGLRPGRPHRGSHHAQRGLQARGKGRSAGHVPQRRLHRPREHGRAPGAVRAVRLQHRRIARRAPAHRPALRRGEAPGRRPRLRAGHPVAHPPSGAGVTDYEIVIGLEVHAQLLTRSKMFCPCPTAFGAPPNTQTCPICQGMPGTLPVVNRRAIEYGLRTALAFDCRVNAGCRFARKHYYYPDMPKNYQISQYEEPLAEDGWLAIEGAGEAPRRIGIQRLHLEEDVGKLVHEGTLDTAQASLVDFNRAGVPLMETVSRPDLRSPEEAATYLRAFRAVLVALGVCNGNMEEGSLRCDANISLRPRGASELGTKVEIKNLNSFRNVQRALEFEARRQAAALEAGARIVQETRLWDADAGVTRSMRTKESAHDYRYFPEPDLVPLRIESTWVDEVRAALPELPRARRQRFATQYGLPAYDAEVLTQSAALADYYERAVGEYPHPKTVSNWVMSELLREIPAEDEAAIASAPIPPAHLAGLLRLVEDGTISGKIAKDVFDKMFRSGQDAQTIVRREGLTQVSDSAELARIVADVVAANAKAVDDYKRGKSAAAKALVGQVMKATGGKANPTLVNQLLQEKLSRE